MSNAIEIIEISSSSSSSDDEEDQEQDDVPLIQLLHSSIRKKNTAMKDENKKKIKRNSIDSDDECMILEHNPFESIDESTNNDDQLQEQLEEEEEDISILSEKGQVACRDFPHSRHLCVKFPFDTTPHQSYCEQCYCYVCDSAAPCEFWLNTSGGHCHAVEKGPGWDAMRKAARPTPTHC
ncbi:hypothetical protein ACHQM5_007664 [Ranunculus cassubicifolius]